MPAQEIDQPASQQQDRQPKRDNEVTQLGPGSLAGNLTADPELRFIPSGRAVGTLRVAVSDRYKDEQTGEWKSRPAEFFTVTCWGILAENACESLLRGDRIVARGRWTRRAYQAKDGNIREVTEFTATDLGPDMNFRAARVERPERKSRS